MAPLAEGLEYTRHMLGWSPWPKTHLYWKVNVLLGVSPRKVLGVAPRKLLGVAPRKAIYTLEQRGNPRPKMALVSPCSAK